MKLVDLSPYAPLLNFSLNVVSLLIMVVLIPIYRHLRRMRDNELHHISADLEEVKHKLDAYAKDAQVAQQRLDEKFDEHLHWHLSQKG
jgi:hypothetical protein